jgi:hypothetical protein
MFAFVVSSTPSVCVSQIAVARQASIATVSVRRVCQPLLVLISVHRPVYHSNLICCCLSGRYAINSAGYVNCPDFTYSAVVGASACKLCDSSVSWCFSCCCVCVEPVCCSLVFRATVLQSRAVPVTVYYARSGSFALEVVVCLSAVNSLYFSLQARHHSTAKRAAVSREHHALVAVSRRSCASLAWQVRSRDVTALCPLSNVPSPLLFRRQGLCRRLQSVHRVHCFTWFILSSWIWVCRWCVMPRFALRLVSPILHILPPP